MPAELNWLIPERTSALAARAVAKRYALSHPLVAQVLLHRGLVNDSDLSNFLHPDLSRLESPEGLRQLRAAVTVLDEALRSGRKMVIYGDYDVDGTTGATLLQSYLRAKGGDVSSFIPMRNEGYGLTRASLDRILSDRRPELLLTVDCGTSSRAEVEYARSRGMEVVVTDHHQPTPGKETSGIVVNPHLAGDAYPNKALAGVAVAYKLVSAHHGKQPVSNLDLVALGTVADVMPLASYTDRAGRHHEAAENRILVRAGLERLAHTHRVGLQALFEAMKLTPQPCPHGLEGDCYPVSAETIGFQIGPRINAIGRMGLDPLLVVELLSAPDSEEGRARATEIAHLLNDTNLERREVTNRLVDEAMAMIDPDDPIIVLQMDLFKGVAGLVAGRLTNEFNRPSIVVDLSGSGSARSTDDIDLLSVLQGSFGPLVTAAGHAGAMGISNVTDPNALRLALRGYDWPEGIGSRELAIDAVCSLADFDRPLLAALAHLEPTGAGNPTPVFAVSGVKVVRRATSKDGRHAFLTLRDEESEISRRAVWFGRGDSAPAEGDLVDVAGRPTLNRRSWDGSESVEMHVLDIRPAVARLPLTLGQAA